jgi:tripartite ATP-independent transporter DctM subunit
MLVISASNIVGYVLTVEAVPKAVAEWALETIKNPLYILLMLNIIMLVVGMFLDLPAAILLLGPTFVAIGNAIGLDLIQLGIMMAVNLSIGLFTPPVGTTLFVAAAISRESIGSIVKELWPFYLVALVVLTLMTYFPALTMY